MKKFIAAAWLIFLLIAGGISYQQRFNRPPIRVGILHSHTGPLAVSEEPVARATLFALAQLNEAGGVLGRKIEPVVSDGCSDPERFASEARRLIKEEGVAVLFGCYSSASRKMVQTVVEDAQHLLVYPVSYEGVENSPNIIYTGALPNQQVIPAVKWAFDQLGLRFYLLGSDYIFPRVANTLIKDLAALLGAQIVGERYLLPGASDLTEIVRDLAARKPAVVFNTLSGETNRAFFQALAARNLTAAELPVFSFTLAETEVRAITQELGPGALRGHYAAWSYFQSLNNKENKEFISAFGIFTGDSPPVTDAMISAYSSVWLWAQAVTKAGGVEPPRVRQAFAGQSCDGPGGVTYIDTDTFHAWKPMRIGQITKQGTFKVLWDSQKPIRPEPYPDHVDVERWRRLERYYYKLWGNHWENQARVPE